MIAVTAQSRTLDFSTPHNQADQIKDTLVRIATSTDAKDWHAMRSQFAESILVHSDTGIPAIYMPACKLVDWATYVFANIESAHFLCSFDVQIDPANPDQAETISYWRAIHRTPRSPSEGARLIHSRCQHTLILTPDGWKVTEIRTTSLEDQNRSAAHSHSRPAIDRRGAIAG